MLGLSLAAPSSAAPITAAEADADQVLAYQATDGYWARHWAESFRGTYAPPRVTGLYDSRVAPIPCGGVDWTSNNAWYCNVTDSVGFDLKFMEQVYSLGDSFIYLVVAHEWGHAIQARLAPDLQVLARELQADCLAGAALFGAARDGAIRWEAGDMQELTASLTSVADAFPWTNVGNHGSAAQRIASFNQGADGPLSCFPDLPPHLKPQPADPGLPPPPPPGMI
jgi:predicted metalloprotease